MKSVVVVCMLYARAGNTQMLSGQYWAGGDSIIMCKQITELTKCGAASLLYTTSPPTPPCVLLLTNPILTTISSPENILLDMRSMLLLLPESSADMTPEDG